MIWKVWKATGGMLAISEGLNLGVVKVTRVGKNQWACVEMKTPGRTFTGEKEARSTLVSL